VPFPAKRFVYIIRSVSHPQRRYIGVTADPSARLHAHRGLSTPPSRFAPSGWPCVSRSFSNQDLATRSPTDISLN